MFSFAGRGIGFIVPIAVAAWFGVGRDTDTFFIAYAFVFFAVGVWGQGIELAALPQIIQWNRATTVNAREEIQWAHHSILKAAVLGVILLAALFALVILPAAGGAVDPRMAWISFTLLVPMFIVAGSASLSAAALNATGHFALPALTQGFRAVGVVGSALLFRRELGIFALAIGYSVGELLRCAVLEGYRRRLNVACGPGSGKSGAKSGPLARATWTVSVWPQFAALALVHAGPLLERWVASHAGIGAITQLDYGLRLFAIPATLFDSSLAAVLLAHWSHAAEADNAAALRNSVMRLVAGALVFAIIVSAICIWQRDTIVDSMLLHGRFDAASAEVVASIFTILMVGFPLGMAALVFERAFMALRRTRTLMGIAGAKLGVRALVAIVLGAKFGVIGIAAAQPASSAIDLTLQAVLWRKAPRK